MPDPLDDSLERELTRLTQYTGEPAQPPLWQAAIEQHRRQQQQRLWVWVRRPLPALAAAAMALLVTSIALQPPRAALSDRTTALAPRSDASLKKLETPAPSPDVATGNAAPASEIALTLNTRNEIPREITQNSRQFDDKMVRQNDDPLIGAANGLAQTPAPDNRYAGVPSANTKETAQPTESHGAASYRGGITGSAAAMPAAASAEKGRPASGNPSVPPAPMADLDAGKTRDASRADTLAVNAPVDASGVPAPSANLVLQVTDPKAFFDYIPTLIDQKQGEQFFALTPDAAKSKADAADKANTGTAYSYTLRVTEDRLPQVMAQLKASGTLKEETTEIPLKQVRLEKLDEQLARQQRLTLAYKDAPPSAPAAPGGGGGAGTGGKEGKEQIDPLRETARKHAELSVIELSHRRERIEKGVDLATVNITAVPVEKPAAESDAELQSLSKQTAGKGLDGTGRVPTPERAPAKPASPPAPVDRTRYNWLPLGLLGSALLAWLLIWLLGRRGGNEPPPTFLP